MNTKHAKVCVVALGFLAAFLTGCTTTSEGTTTIDPPAPPAGLPDPPPVTVPTP